MSRKPKFDAFWSARGQGYETNFNRWATSRAAAVLAYLAARLGLTPNQVTLMSLFCGLVTFLVSFVVPVGLPGFSIAVIVILAELTFILDCADGLLARVTDRATPFGSLLDRTLDIASQACALCAVYVYIYRSAISAEDFDTANAALVVGFLFLLTRNTRHMAIHLSNRLLGQAAAAVPSNRNALSGLPTDLLEYQVSVIAVLAYLVSPLASLALFGMQTLMCAASVVRRLARATNLERI